eukprot:PhM_4_TR4880/c0_g1_i2/m.35347
MLFSRSLIAPVTSTVSLVTLRASLSSVRRYATSTKDDGSDHHLEPISNEDDHNNGSTHDHLSGDVSDEGPRVDTLEEQLQHVHDLADAMASALRIKDSVLRRYGGTNGRFWDPEEMRESDCPKQRAFYDVSVQYTLQAKELCEYLTPQVMYMLRKSQENPKTKDGVPVRRLRRTMSTPYMHHHQPYNVNPIQGRFSGSSADTYVVQRTRQLRNRDTLRNLAMIVEAGDYAMPGPNGEPAPKVSQKLWEVLK